MPDDVQSKLDAAKKVLAGARKFQASAGGPISHEYSGASYSAARAARQTPKPSGPAAPTTGDELASKSSNVDNYVKGVSGQ